MNINVKAIHAIDYVQRRVFELKMWAYIAIVKRLNSKYFVKDTFFI